MKIKKSYLNKLIEEETHKMKEQASKEVVVFEDVVRLLGSDILLEEVRNEMGAENFDKFFQEVLKKKDLKIPLTLLKK